MRYVSQMLWKSAYSLGARQIVPSWHALFARRTDELEYDLRLMNVALASQDRLALEHLAKDAACTPHVDGWRVLSKLEEQLRRPVPPSDNQ